MGKMQRRILHKGRKKSIIFSLKISEIDILIKEKKEYPIFIMDDIASYFDEVRKKSILSYFVNKKNSMFYNFNRRSGHRRKKIYCGKGEDY